MVTEEQVIEYLESLTIIQLNDLVKKLEEKWDVKAACGGGMVVAAAAAPVAEEPTEFKVILADVAPTKSTSSKKSVPSRTWASKKPKNSSTALLRLSKKASKKPKPKTSRRNSKPLAPKSKSKPNRFANAS